MILKEFIEWHDQVKDEITDVMSLMSKPLSQEPEELIRDLEVIESWYARMGSLLAMANSFLDRGRNELLPEKEMGMTDLTRKLALDAAASPIRMSRDGLDSICEGIKQRIILGESILRYMSQFSDRTVKEEKIW